MMLVVVLVGLPVLAQEPPPKPLTKEQQEKLKDLERFHQDALKLWEQGRGPEAVAAVEKVLAIERELLGNVHLEVAGALEFLAMIQASLDDFPAARKARQEVLSIKTKLLGPEHWQVTDARIALEDVERLARMAPTDRRRLADAEPLSRQAVQLYQQGKTREAIPLAQRVMDTRRQLLGERHPDYASSLNNLAAMYVDQGEYAKAAPLYHQALEIRSQVLREHHPDYATSLNNLAELCQIQGEYAKAEPLYRQALAVVKEALGERHAHYASSLNNLANVYRLQGEYSRAEPLYRQALEIRKQVMGERHADYAADLNNLALLYRDQGEYAKAESLYRQALEIKKHVLGTRHPSYASSLNNLATLYRLQGEYVQAEALLRQALEIRKRLGERHPDYASSLRNLAALYQAQGEYAKAEPLFLRVVEMRKQLLGERHPRYATNLNDLASLYFAQGKYAQAESLFRQASGIYKHALGEHHPNHAICLSNLAVLYRTQGKYTQVEPLHHQALAALRQRPGSPPAPLLQLTAGELRPLPDTVGILAEYCASLEQRLGSQPTAAQLRAADHAFALFLAVRERVRQEVLEHDASKLHHGAEAFDMIPRRIGLCQRLFDRESQGADLETALATAEQGSARVFLEQLGKARALSVGRVSSELRQQEAALRRQLREFDTRIAKEQDKPADKRDPDKVGQLLDQQKQVEAQLSELIGRMEKDFPQYAGLKYPKPCSLAEARACLAANEVALHFVPGDQQSYVVLVEARPARDDKANGLAICALPGRRELTDGISCLTNRDTFAHGGKARAVAAQAYDLLLTPLKDRIRGKDLVIVPDGPLGYVPFEVLLEDGHYLIEKHRIRYAPSLTVLHLIRQWHAQREVQPERSLWALGDPLYQPTDSRLSGPTAAVGALAGDWTSRLLVCRQLAAQSTLASTSRDALRELEQREGRRGERFPRLRHSGEEVRAVGRLVGAPADAILTGGQAREAAVKDASASGALARARYVHFATHGILGLDIGQQPALVLSLVGNDEQRDEDGGINDGFLRLDEVTRLKLNADLVVLSACETGRGRLYAGEGVSGLARAFLYAGSRGVVCSLWSVDDRETAILMTRLYSGLKDGQAAADALRAAKLEMIRAGKPPVYWAPFILIGE
jgi:CHAT domain-containing protein/Tfp pilus assembly protein PilF